MVQIKSGGFLVVLNVLSSFGNSSSHILDSKLQGCKKKKKKKLQLISWTFFCLHLIVLFTPRVSGKLSFGKPLSAAAVWSSPSACYFSAVSVILWIMSQTPMQCDRLVPLRFPNQVSSPPALPDCLLAAFTESWCSGAELHAEESGLCWCWPRAKVPRLSAPFCPSMWEGGSKVAEAELVYYLCCQRDSILRKNIAERELVKV